MSEEGGTHQGETINIKTSNVHYDHRFQANNTDNYSIKLDQSTNGGGGGTSRVVRYRNA